VGPILLQVAAEVLVLDLHVVHVDHVIDFRPDLPKIFKEIPILLDMKSGILGGPLSRRL
jgi:hypothetical protein